MKVVYDWLKEYIGEEMPEMNKLEELFTFHAFEIDGIEEIGGEEVIDVKVLPDRAGDCLSHRGIARELSALIGKPLVKDPLASPVTLSPMTEKVRVTIENPDNCRRFGCALLTGVSVKESPEWLRARLEALGQRSINNVVDATNYVMLALGQPLHAYDGDKFPHADGVWHFGVRMAKEGEEVAILGGNVHVLKDTVQVITEAGADSPVGIAGIKGGKAAEIDTGTTTVILEAANFNPQVTRKGAQVLKLQTDASKRFENNISPELVPYALTECVNLILEIAGGTGEGYADVYPSPEKNREVAVTLVQINALLGVALTEGAVEDIFTRLGFTYTKGGGGWSVAAPFERRDILIPEDVIAEVGRVYGYEHVTSVEPEQMPVSEVNARHYYSEKVRELLVAEGFSEVITSSFRKKDEIELLNALASDKGCLRSSLRENIKEVLDRNMPNADLLGVTNVQVFEIGTVFTRTADGTDVIEHISVALGVRMKQQGFTPKDDERLKEVVKKIEGTLGVAVEAHREGGVAEIDMTALIERLPVPTAYDAYVANADVRFTPYSSYPFISRDIALWVPEPVSAEEIESLLREKAGELLVRISLFDEFKKDGRTSYAFRLVFQSFERTLTDEEVGVIMGTLTAEAKSRDFEVR
jgi:phenylalanyl-tRNA synthetase beta chain